jgi:DNA processing protein
MSRIVTASSAEWPSSLDELGPYDPPARLFVAGRSLPSDDAPVVAVVGTRRPTATGVRIAQEIAAGLCAAGAVVVSGLAVGIDAAAHRAALEACGHTVAVLGCGLDVDYPHHNARLRNDIESSGTLVTEYEAEVQPARHHFPLRNRIIAGLSDGVVVVEGALTSGALVTARLALDCNREVFAVPGSVRNPMAEGPNELIRSSQAALVTSAAHVLEELAPGSTAAVEPLTLATEPVELDLEEEAALLTLDDTPLSMEHVCAAAGLEPGAAATALSRLELRGLVERSVAGYARAAPRR